MKKRYIFILFVYFFFNSYLNAQIELTHNVGNEVINTGMFSCPEPEYFARTFTLQDFGIALGSEFEITSGEFAIASSYGGAMARFNIYEIDENFPDTFDENNLIGSSQIVNIPYVYTYGDPEIINVEFQSPVVVPSGVSRILVEVEKIDNPNEVATFVAHFAGTELDNDFSWYKGCGGAAVGNDYLTTLDTAVPKPNARFYIKVTGTDSIINAQNECLGETVDFSLSSNETFDSALWDFGDGQTAIGLNVSHLYLNSGNYDVNVSATYNGETLSGFKTIEIYENPNVSTIVNLSQCDENSDGFTIFNLTNVNSNISANYLSETITFYESQFNAENEIEAIVAPTEYPNETINSDIVWARVENENGCFATSQVNLNVTSTQIPDTYFRDFYECDTLMDIHDGITVFDFSIVNSEIETMFPNGQNLNISYYENLLDAYGNLNSIQDISNYTNTTPIAQDIYVRVVNPLNSECLGIGHYITLHVVEMPIVTGPLLIEECDYDNDGLMEFSTSNFEYLLSDLQTLDVSFRYYDEDGNELPSPLPDPFITSDPITNITVSIIAENQNIPSGGCEVTTGITLFINSDYNIGEVPDYFGCLDASDNFFTFDTSNLESSILNGQNDLEISYFDENSNLIESPFPNEYSLSESATIRAIVTNNQDPMLCPLEIDINFEVALKPEDIQIDDVYLCFEEGEEQIFYLREYLDASLEEYSITNSEINAYSNGVLYDDIINVNFQNLNQAEINYRIENADFPECYSIGSFNIISSKRPVIGDLSDIILCDDESNDGFENLDLQSINEEILNDLPTNQYTISYFESYDNALENINQLEEMVGSTDDKTIYVRVSSQENIDCYDISDFNLVVKPVPDISEIQNEYYICKGESLIVIAGDGLDYYYWSNGMTTSSISITEAGEYSVTVLRDYPEISCEVTKTFVVYESEEPNSVEIVVVGESITSNDIQIIASGIGDYEYSLDGITYQDSNIFYDLTQGDYTVYIRDRNGCGVYIEELFLLRYPKFFTPNNDTENDYWQLYNANKELLNKLYIFDRYGKLLIELDPRSVGWDGTYNGLQMPSSDYWFMLERQNGKTYTGHFALIR